MIDSEGSSLLNALQKYYAELVAFLTKRFGCADFAAEVAQETYLRVQQTSSHRAIDHPRAYVFKTATHLAIDRLRRDKAHATYLSSEPVPDDVPSGSPSPEDSLDAKQRLAILREAIAELPPKCRRVFLLHKFDELSHADIAARLGISRNMVEKHVIKALAHCRDRLDGPTHESGKVR